MYTLFRLGITTILLLTVTVAPFSRDSLLSQLPPLTAKTTVSGNPTFGAYLRHYGLDTIGIVPVVGTFRSDDYTCVGQIYRCKNSRGTVFFLHGLFDHAGTLTNGILACLGENFSVATFDLPGHGLSDGKRATINDFGEYARALREFIVISRPHTDSPYVFIGHSTGCSVGYEYVLSSGEQPFTRMIFLAPLAQSAWYHFSMVGNAALKPFVSETPRWYRSASHDDTFLQRQREDPLGPDKFSLGWAAAYFLWWERAQVYRKRALPLTIIQGTSDGVVDWKHNLSWFPEKIDGCSIVTISKARHQLLNETQPYRDECTNTIRKILREVR